jgi:hypothetical protein
MNGFSRTRHHKASHYPWDNRGGASNRYSVLLSREPESNQTNPQTFDGSASFADAFSQSTQVRFDPSLHDLSPSISALNAGLSGISSTPTSRSIFLPYGFPVRTADQPPPPPPLIDTGGSFDTHQWGPLDTDLLAVFTTGADASPSL